MAKSSKKVPKRFAGVKLPKRLRRELKSLLASDEGRQIVQGAVNSAAEALANKAERSAVGPALAQAFGEAGRTFQGALDARRMAVDTEAEWTEPLGGPDLPRVEDLH